MSFQDAIKNVLGQYAGFSGRARRSEYWYWTLALVLAYVVAVVVDSVIGITAMTIVVFLGSLLPGLAVAVRRLHDTGRSGWFFLLGFIPFVGGIILLVFFVQDSQRNNQYGPSPKELAA